MGDKKRRGGGTVTKDERVVLVPGYRQCVQVAVMLVWTSVIINEDALEAFCQSSDVRHVPVEYNNFLVTESDQSRSQMI